jgi:hypothetical protein
MSNLSELLPAGAGAKSADFVASGTLGSGVTVALKSDGTVEAVSGATEGAGTPVVFESASTFNTASTYDSSNNKVVIAYRDNANSDYGTAVVGTVSGTSISFGTPVVFESAQATNQSATYDSSNNKVVIAYKDEGNSDYGTAIVGTVSGTSISFGSAVVFNSQGVGRTSTTYDSTNGKVIIAWHGLGDPQDGAIIVGTVSGTSISFGSKIVFESLGTPYLSLTYDSTLNKIVLAYTNNNNNSYGTAVVGTVSGTSISFGSKIVFNSAITQWVSAVYDSSNNKVVIAYADVGNSSYGTAVVGTISGTSISFGSEVVFENAASTYLSAAYDSNANKVVIAYATTAGGNVIVGVASGTSISFGSAVVFESGNGIGTHTSTTYDSSNNKVVISYRGSSNFGKSVVFTVGATNNTDFIGITDQAIADTATGAVIVQGGVSDKVSSLTTGSDYYVQSDGSLSTTVSSVPAGRALSTTSILLEG